MLRWATHILDKLNSTAARPPSTSEADAGEEGAAPQQQQKPHGPRHDVDVPPLKPWWPVVDAEDSSRGPVGPPLLLSSVTLADVGTDDGYCSPGVLDLVASLSFSTPAPHATSGTAAPAMAATGTGGGNSTTTTTTTTTDVNEGKDDVGDFLQNVIAGKTDVLRKQLAQQKLEAAAASANAGNNSSRSHTRGAGAGTGDGAVFAGGSANIHKSSITPAAMSSAPTGGREKMGPTKSGMAETGTAGTPVAPGYTSQQQQQTRRQHYVSSAARSLQDYELIAFLGNGTFAEVTLARNKITGEYFAVKKISKQRVKEEGCIERTFTERQLLAKLHHPFLVRLYQAFQSQTHLYLVLDFAQGGDLYYLNRQQLWNRSMKRNLVKMQYPYYQSTSSTFTPVPPPPSGPLPPGTNGATVATATPAQSQQPQAPLSFSISATAGTTQVITDTALQSFPHSAEVVRLAEAATDAQLQEASSSSGTTTSQRNAFLASLSMADGVWANTLSSTSRSGITVTNTATGEALPPLAWAHDDDASATAGTTNVASATATHDDEVKETSTDLMKLDSSIDRKLSRVAVSPSMATRQRQQQQQQQGRREQRGAIECPDRDMQLTAEWRYYLADAVDEFVTSRNTERKRPTTACVAARTTEATEPPAVTGRVFAASVQGNEAASWSTSVASTSREGYQPRWRTLPAAQRGGGGACRGRRSASPSSSSSTAQDSDVSDQRSEVNKALVPGIGAASRSPLSPAGPAPCPQRSADGSSDVTTVMTHTERHERNSGGAGESRRDGELPSAGSIKSTPSPAEPKRRQLRRASAAELADALAVTAASAKMRTASLRSGMGGTRRATKRVKEHEKTAESLSQLMAEAKGPQPLASSVSSSSNITTTAAATTASSVTSATNTTQLRRTHIEIKTASSRKKRTKAQSDIDRRPFSSDIADPARQLSDFVTTTPVGSVTAALRVDLATPFHQVAMEGSTSELSTKPGAEIAPDEAHRFPLRLIAFYAVEVALVLQYLHGEGFLYRDLKPENILMRSDGHVMLTDFGVAKYRKGAIITPSATGDGTNVEDASSLSSSAGAGTDGRANSFTGTTQYMSPEMLRGQPHDSRTDWWSYGCLLFEWANGRKAFDAANQFVLFRSIVEEDVRITAEDYRLTLLEVHTRVAQLHYRAEEVRLELKERVARQMRRNLAQMPQPSKLSAALSLPTAEVVYNPNNRSFDVRLRSATTPVIPPPQPATDRAVSASEGLEEAEGNVTGDSCTSRQQSTGRYTQNQHTHQPVQSHDHGSPYVAATTVMLNDSFMSQLGALNPNRASSADDDTQGLPSQSLLNNSFATNSFAGIGSSSVILHSGVPANLSLRLTTSAALQHQQEQQERRRRHQRGRLRLSCLTLDEATRDLYITDALAQMKEALALLRDLTTRLLERRVEHRLSGEAVLEHPFFTCAYVVSQLYYSVYHERLLSTEVRRFLRTALSPVNSAVDLVTTSVDEPQRQTPLSTASTVTSLAATATTTTTTTAAAAVPRLQSPLPVLPLPPQTRPEDWRELFMERRIPAPYTPRLRTRDDLRYFPAAVTATGLSAAAEQHRRIKEAKEYQKEFMMMRASANNNNNKVSTVSNNSFDVASFTATLSCSHSQLLANGSGSGGGPPLALVPLDVETAQRVQQLLAANCNTLTMQHHDDVSALSKLNSDESRTAAPVCATQPALGMHHPATAPIPLTSPGVDMGVDITQQQPVVPTLQLPSVEVMGAGVAPLSDASLPATKTPNDMLLQSSVFGNVRVAEDAEEAQQQCRLSCCATNVALADSNNAAATSTAVETTECIKNRTSLPDPVAVSTLTSHMSNLPSAGLYSPRVGPADMSCADTSPSSSRASSIALTKALADGLGDGSGGSATAGGMIAESRPDFFDRAATLPQSFLDAALVVAAAAQKKQQQQQQQQHSASSVPASSALSADLSEVRHGCAEATEKKAIAAVADLSCASGSTDVTVTSTGADLSSLMDTDPTLHATSLVQQQLTKASDIMLNGSRSSTSRKTGYATAAAAADSPPNGTLVPHDDESDGTQTFLEAARVHPNTVECEDHDGGGGYYEPDAFAEEDAHVADGGDAPAALEEEPNGGGHVATVGHNAVIETMASTMEASSCDHSNVSAQPLTPTRQGTLLSTPRVLSSTSTGRLRNGPPSRLSPDGDDDDEADGVRSREGVSCTGPLSTAPIKALPTASTPCTSPDHLHPPLCGGATSPMYSTLEGTRELTTPTPKGAMTPIRQCGDVQGDLSAFAASSVFTSTPPTTTTHIDDSQQSLSTSLGDSGVGRLYGTSSACATPLPTEKQAPVRGRQERSPDRHLHCFPSLSLAVGEQQPQRLFSDVTSVSKPSLGVAPPSSIIASSTHAETTTGDAGRSSAAVDVLPSANVVHRGVDPSSNVAAAVTRPASVNVRDDRDDVCVADEVGYTTSPDGECSSRSSKGGHCDDDKSDIDDDSAATTTTPSSSQGKTEKDMEREADELDGTAQQPASSASSISTTSTTSTSEHTFTMYSGASSTNSQDDSDTAATTDTGAADLHQTPMGSPMPKLVVANLRGAVLHGGAGTSTSGDVMAAGNPNDYVSPMANAHPPADSRGSSSFLGNALSSYPSINAISGSGDMVEPYGLLTATLSGVEYNVDDEANTGSLTETPWSPRGFGWSLQKSRAVLGGNVSSSSSGRGPPSTSDRRGVQALWAQQQRKRIARGLQQLHQRHQQLDPSAGKPLLCETGAESERRDDSSDSGEDQSGESNQKSNKAINPTGMLCDLAFNDDADSVSRPHQRPPQQQQQCLHGVSPQHPPLHTGLPYHQNVSDYDDGNDMTAAAAATGPDGRTVQRLFSLSPSACEHGRNYDHDGDKCQQNSASTHSGNEGRADNSAGVTTTTTTTTGGGGGGVVGGFDHFQNFSFTSPQILQQYLASSPGSGGGGGGGHRHREGAEVKPPYHQRPRL